MEKPGRRISSRYGPFVPAWSASVSNSKAWYFAIWFLPLFALLRRSIRSGRCGSQLSSGAFDPSALGRLRPFVVRGDDPLRGRQITSVVRGHQLPVIIDQLLADLD